MGAVTASNSTKSVLATESLLAYVLVLRHSEEGGPPECWAQGECNQGYREPGAACRQHLQLTPTLPGPAEPHKHRPNRLSHAISNSILQGGHALT